MWWSWTPTAGGSVRVSTVGSSVDTLLAIYTGDAVTSLVEVASNNNRSDGDQQSEVFFYAQAGQTYRIALDSALGTDGSLTLKLDQVLGNIPVIWRSPQKVWSDVGSDAVFSVAATGAGALSYQWFWGTLELLGETNASLSLRSVASNQAGEYWVRVSNAACSTDSERGLLEVVQVHELGHRPRPQRGHSTGVHVLGDLAYVANLYGGLQILDVSNPALPIHVADYMTTGLAFAVQVVGNVAYVADGAAGLEVLDVSNPASPVRLGGYDTGGSARGVHVVGPLAYVAAECAGLVILDVSEPAAPVRVGGYGAAVSSQAVRVVGNTAYLTDLAAGLEVLDVTNPALPVRLGGYDTEGLAYEMQVLGNLAYVADGEAGLQVFDVSLPASPTRVSWTDTRGSATAVHVAGNLAYLADREAGLQILDVSNPVLPVQVGSYNTTGDATDVQVVGTLAYLAVQQAGLHILDVSHPALPAFVGEFDTSGSAFGVHVVGNLAYVADQTNGLQILDVSNPASPVRVGHFDTSGYAYAVQVVGSIAFVADWDEGLQILDVSDPTAPVPLGRYHTSGYARGVQVVGTVAYVADEHEGLQMLDVSDPRAPMLLGRYDPGDYAAGVQVAGNLGFLANGGLGLQVLDVSNPSEPVRLAGYHSRGFASDVQVAGDVAYVADGRVGLTIIGMDPSAGPPVLVRQSESRSVVEGTVLQLDVWVNGASTFHYQWYHDGMPLENATNALLTLRDLRLDQGGSYSVNITNALGHAESADMKLTVLEIPRGYEADVTPRPYGHDNGSVTVTDWVQVGRFVTGLDELHAGSEFSRADCAPRLSGGLLIGGNGVVSVSDWVQAGRYAAGLDPITVAMGPTAPPQSQPAAFQGVSGAAALKRLSTEQATVRLKGAERVGLATWEIPVELDGLGSENALGFSVAVAPGRGRIEEVELGEGAAGAVLLSNQAQVDQGRVGVIIALPTGETWARGGVEIARVRLQAIGSGEVPVLTWGDEPIRRELVNVEAETVAVEFVEGSAAEARGVPKLEAAMHDGTLQLRWVNSGDEWIVERTKDLELAEWEAYATTPSRNGASNEVRISGLETQAFFRLRRLRTASESGP